MGTEPVPDMSNGSDYASLRKRRLPNANLIGWSFTCQMCDCIEVLRADENINADLAETGIVKAHMRVPNRCELCSKDKYAWQTRKTLQKVLPERANGSKASLHTYTLGTALEVQPEAADDRYYELHGEMKHAFRKLTNSKWWRNRVDGMFYTIEVKRTDTPDGLVRLHPHVHAIVLHQKRHDFKSAAENKGLGSYTYVRRIRGGIQRPINYILKYALKGYGDTAFKGRYYETTGKFRKQGVKSGTDLTEDAAANPVRSPP